MSIAAWNRQTIWLLGYVIEGMYVFQNSHVIQQAKKENNEKSFKFREKRIKCSTTNHEADKILLEN